jgi:hypothetical protein
MPGISDSIDDHLYRQSEEEFVEEIFHSSRSEFCARDFEGSLTVEFAMRLAHPFSRLLAIIPDVFGGSEHSSQPFCLLAFIDGKPFTATLPRCLWNHLELIGARDAAVSIKAC